MGTADETDARTISATLVNASDVAAFAFTCWLLALTTKAFTKFAPNQIAGQAVTAGFLVLAAAAGVCVTTRLFKAHYQHT
jgi:hypothetical protein